MNIRSMKELQADLVNAQLSAREYRQQAEHSEKRATTLQAEVDRLKARLEFMAQLVKFALEGQQDFGETPGFTYPVNLWEAVVQAEGETAASQEAA